MYFIKFLSAFSYLFNMHVTLGASSSTLFFRMLSISVLRAFLTRIAKQVVCTLTCELTYHVFINGVHDYHTLMLSRCYMVSQ